MGVKRFVVLVDDLDEKAINQAIAVYQRRNQGSDGKGTLIPEGESSLGGAILGELCRNYLESIGEWIHD